MSLKDHPFTQTLIKMGCILGYTAFFFLFFSAVNQFLHFFIKVWK